ncbi:hypothetical protein J4H86_01255 [Spiractinospora alimapuensis]|uniref:hypothetical protein n=1 Tax=Spiractinospora alimapuensis TaxID=2820884 RepID=UPI001F3908B8|nr:hypothetical protein [Spiractinospora alimapuensis]QVQ52513.1 hypothetical protein J4H86_01255 [Spiractinospora alimapuensis]
MTLDPGAVASLHQLATDLTRLGMRARVDPVTRSVDVATTGVSARGPNTWVALRAVLRPHGEDLWWWVTIPGGDLGYVPGERPIPAAVPVAPATAVDRVVARIRGVLDLDVP